MTVRLAAVVVTHNRLEKLRVTVQRLLAEPVDHVLVFDNASTDGTSDWLAGLDDPRLIHQRSSENRGGAGGFSDALRHVRDDLDPDWVVVMDDDGRPQPGAFAAFRAGDWRGWDALGAAVFHPDGRVCEMNRPYRNPFWRGAEFRRTLARMASGRGRQGFHLPDAAYAHNAPVVDVDMASFVGLFLSRDALRRAGLPDPRLFIYGDDQLYTLTMRRRGLRIGFAPALRFDHDTQAVQAAQGLVLRPMWKVFYMYRNALIAYRVAAGLAFWPLVPVLLAKWRRKARDYGDDAALFRRILRVAVRDGLAGRLDRGHDDVLMLAQGEQG
ncbi:glycosyltransferase [Paracoccus sp. (in: a-proteobacteria)]|uniref:glycosyltransferase n=1 Tax=Paracoccus sp. TaxID=267 RepID=UPI0026DF8C76|nr:glycosyltransferase [Paracoccus sp. (in: a-proteobacteria)]MDO5647667.1 glycosyltransferase [Paracoccus sp. (in: a-proteobacteria)]